MFTSKSMFFFRIVSAILIVNIFIAGCTLPEGLVRDLADGLAGLELFVATTGNDASDCQTPETACRSVSHAVVLANEMTAGLIHIAPGTYNETSDIRILAPMTLLGAAGVVVNRTGDLPGIPSTLVISPPLNSMVRIEQMEIRSTSYGVTISSGRVFLDEVDFNDIATHAIHISPDVDQAAVSISNATFSNTLGSVIVSRSVDVSITLRNATLTGGRSTPILNYGSTIDLIGVEISNNQAESSYPSAILNTGDSEAGPGVGGILRITNSVIHDNTHRGSSENTATIRQGGEFLEMTNSTISGNDGNGIEIGRTGETNLTHVTIADQAEVGILGQTSLNFRVKLQNSLVVYNGRDCDFRTIYTSGIPESRTVILDTIDSDNTCRDPLVEERAAWDFFPGVDGRLRDNGGGTLTHALLAGSAAIDTAACISGLTSDQRGVTRPQGLGCDAGAYESEVELGEPPFALSSTPLAIVQQSTPGATLPVVQTEVVVTPTLSPFVRFIDNGFCRSGPGTIYAVVTGFQPGSEVPAEGRNNENTWWVLNFNGVRCWAAASVVETFGPVAGLPVIPAPPTPTPTATATTSLQPPLPPQQLSIETRVCTGSVYSVSLRWLDPSGNEQGYRIYRDGVLIAIIGINSISYKDNPPYGGPYQYGVESFNAAGASSRQTVNEAGCIP